MAGTTQVLAWSPLAEWVGWDKGGTYLGDAELETDMLLLAVLVVYYFTVVAVCGLRTTKQKAWVLTSISASSCFLLFFVNVWQCGFSLDSTAIEKSQVLMDTPFSRFTSRYFRVTLLTDLGMGVLFYPDQLDLLTSWFHHLAYFCLMNWAITKHVTFAFSLFLVEELPTFLLALGSINKRLRTDYGFGLSFFILRILYHSVHFYTIFITWSRDTDGLMDVIRFNMLLTMALHLYWFKGWVGQQMRRLNGKERKKKS
mmetsp:Transcript_73/g.219  ORF Transcript_73/g.219 Transcript_73/m.219 type:complete len:256 (-) Transcript_73:3634-4401(-)